MLHFSLNQLAREVSTFVITTEAGINTDAQHQKSQHKWLRPQAPRKGTAMLIIMDRIPPTIEPLAKVIIVLITASKPLIASIMILTVVHPKQILSIAKT